MNTEKLHELLIEFAEGTLSAARRNEVEAMLADSPELRSEVEFLRSTFKELHTDVDGTVPDHYFTSFLPRLREKLDQGSRSSLWSIRQLARTLTQAAYAAVIVVSLYGFYQVLSPEIGQSSIYSLVAECEQNDINAIIDGSSAFFSDAADSVIDARLPDELFGIDPSNYQTENEVFALLEDQDAEQVVLRLQKTITP